MIWIPGVDVLIELSDFDNSSPHQKKSRKSVILEALVAQGQLLRLARSRPRITLTSLAECKNKLYESYQNFIFAKHQLQGWPKLQI